MNLDHLVDFMEIRFFRFLLLAGNKEILSSFDLKKDKAVSIVIIKMSYSVRANCSKCGKSFTVSIPKGISRDTWKKGAECKFCGLKGSVAN